MMRSEQVQYFLEAAKTGSMRQVAEKYFVTQPAVSAALSKLEEELGVTLMTRSNQGVVLTDAGKVVQTYFLSIQKSYKEMQRLLNPYRMSNQMNQEKGGLELCATPEINMDLVQSVIQYFDARFPNCVVSVKEYDFFNLIEIVGCEQAELGIFCIAEEILQERNVLDRLGANGLTYEKVGSDLLSVVVKKDSSFAQKTSISLSTILKHPLVVYAASEEHCWHRMLFKKYVDEPHFICTNSYVFLKDLLEKKGYFMFLLNRKFHKIDAIDTLTVIPVKENIKVTIGVLFKKDTDHSIFSQRFIASMKAYLQSL